MMKINATLQKSSHVDADLLVVYLACYFLFYCSNMPYIQATTTYMRTHPVAFGRVDPRGPVYLTLGAGGNREGHASAYQQHPAEPWVARRTLQDFGYGHLHVRNTTHARFQWIRDRTSTNNFEDVVWFHNPHAHA